MHLTCILGEAYVEEENNGGIPKPLVVTNGIKEF
jgi:hypothetical protein